MNYVNELLHSKHLSLCGMGETALDESITRAITNFGNKHYDDACLVAWQFKTEQQNK